jgi:hypothetical protein
VAAFVILRRGESDDRPLVLEVPVPADLTLTGFWSTSALSPDGRSVLSVGQRGTDATRLWLWQLDSPTPVEIPGSDEAFFPVWSPDGRSFA